MRSPLCFQYYYFVYFVIYKTVSFTGLNFSFVYRTNVDG